MEKTISIPKAELEQLRHHVTEALKIIDSYTLPDAPVKKLSKSEERIQHFSELLTTGNRVKKPKSIKKGLPKK